MEINKITFENNQRNLGISQSFEDLDVNNDGVISEKDVKAAKNASIANIINNVLDNVDDEAEIVNATKTSAAKSDEKTAAKRNSYGVMETDAANFDKDVKNSKGTVYVIMGNLSGCGFCVSLENQVKANLKELESKCAVYNLDWNANNNLCWDIYRQGGGEGSVGFPQIAKFVDGKFVELIDNPRNASAAVKAMLEKAEGTKGTADTKETEETDKTKEGDKAEGDKIDAATEERIGNLTKEIKDISDEIATLNTTLKTYQGEKTELEAEKADKEEAVRQAQEEYDEEQSKLERYTHEYDDYQKEVDVINKEILEEQNREEEEFNEAMSTAVDRAVNNYDPAKDGKNFNTYFLKFMNNAHFPTFSKLDDMNSAAKKLSGEAKACMRNILSQVGVVSAAKRNLDTANANLDDVNNRLEAKNKQITDIEGQIAAKEATKSAKEKELEALKTGGKVTEGAGLSAKEVLSQISDAEKQILKDNNISLTDCIVAKGEDGKFHVYKHSEKEGADYYISVARWYGKDKGYDIVPEGSGFVMDLADAKEGEGKAIYTFTKVNDDMTDGEVTEKAGCYSMCSPLSFDVDGNGINTTNETVSFDIDGDGELDTVNNSSDWVMAFDKDHDGIAGEDGSELFGDNTDLDGDGKADGYKDGFDALKALAKKEGLIGNGDSKLDADDLKKLSDKYGLTMTNGYGGEAKSFADLGITEINLATTDKTSLTKNFDGRNNDIMTQEGATFVVNGETHEYADIWNAKKDASEAVKAENETKTSTAKFENNTVANLSLNKDGVIALEGNVDFSAIKNKAVNNADIPKEILEEIVEIKEDV